MAFEERLSQDQREAVAFDGNLSLVSCPGSGKTRVIVAKLLACAEQVLGSPRKIACITFTNAGVYEIEQRLRQQASEQESAVCEISTIHGFCLNQIIRPFSTRIPELSSGFTVIAPDSEFYKGEIQAIIQKFGLKQFQEEAFTSIQRKLNGAPFVPKDIPEAAAIQFIERLSKPGMLTLADIVFYSARLVSSDEDVARALACKFSWILVDEFQDTSDLQASLLVAIEKKKKTKIFLVGDPHQSIFAFAGARPDLMLAVARRIGARTDISLTGNHRSSSRIVTSAERLLGREPKMEAVGQAKDFVADVEWVHAVNPLNGILGTFLPALKKWNIELGGAAILSPQWPVLYQVGRALREKGVPVMGPGARPYKKSLDFAQFAEAACAHLELPSPESSIKVQRSLYQMLLIIGGEPVPAVFTFEGKRILLSILNFASAQRRKSMSALEWLAHVSVKCEEILISNEMLPQSAQGKLIESGMAMIDAIRKNVPTYSTLSVDDLSIFARPSECLHLQTMHSSKGREFEAVALIGFNEGLIPHFAAKMNEEIEEARRLAYVGVTRARRLLMIISDTSNPRNGPSRFIAELGL